MISIKGGTKTWSTAEQQSALTADRSQTMSAADRDRVLGDESVGDLLNKVADPNWVDPAKTRKVGNDQLDKDAFLKLLLAQLKNQDPTNPMQSHEMAAQLAQFSSLEKLANIDSGIEKIGNQSQPKVSFEALQLIGKAVSGDSSRLVRVNESETHDVQFELMGEAISATAKIRGPDGTVLREQMITNLKPGKNEFAWNGMDANGRFAAPGEYQVVIEAKDMSGKKVGVQTAFEGVISGVNFGKDGPVVMIGNKAIRMNDIKKIVDPAHAPKSAVHRAEATAIEAGSDTSGQPNAPTNLEGVAMSRAMLNRLQKEGGQ